MSRRPKVKKRVEREKERLPIYPQIFEFFNEGEVKMLTYFPDKWLLENCLEGLEEAKTSIREFLAEKISYDTIEIERDSTWRVWEVRMSARRKGLSGSNADPKWVNRIS